MSCFGSRVILCRSSPGLDNRFKREGSRSMFNDPTRHEGHDRLSEGKEDHEHRPHSELEAEEEILAELNSTPDEEDDEAQS